MMSLQRGEDPHSTMLSELCSLVLNIIRSPPTPINFSDELVVRRVRRRGPSLQQITPAEIASLMFGISLALMLSGFVTFFIGFFLMPWVLGFAMVFYVFGLISSLSMLWRAVFCCSSSYSSPRKDCSSWRLL